MKKPVLFATVSVLIGIAAFADDVKIRPAAGSGVVITDSTGTAERLRVNDNGQTFLPALLALPTFDRFMCIDTSTGHIGTCVPPTGSTGPQGPAGPAGLTWRGDWKSATAYVPGDAVSSNGSSFLAVAASTNQQPVNGALWNLLAQKGADGQAAQQIIQVCTNITLICMDPIHDCPLTQPCPPKGNGQPDPECDPNSYSLKAFCPDGYIRLGVVECKRLDSLGANAKIFYPAYDKTQAQCVYTGSINKGFPTKELFVMRMLCIQEFQDPCLRPTMIERLPVVLSSPTKP
jgi:hypothetical protein